MRTVHCLPTLALLLAVTATGAIAAARSSADARNTYQRVDDFSWSEDGQSLALHSRDDSGVIVTRAEPAPFHGLQRGDVILAVDGKPVQQVAQVTRALRGRTSPVALRVRRGRTETTLVWSHADYRRFASPAPPPPPAPHN
jgi:C-terminal processing protease CtpA/Prc